MRNRAWLVVLIVCFLLPYSKVNGWGFIPAFVAIVVCAERLRGKQGIAWLGLRMSAAHFSASLVLSAALAIAFRPLILDLASRSGLSFDSSSWEPLLRTRPVFQALNEEMLFRAALIGSLLERFGNRSRAQVLFGTGAFFALSHFAFYAWKDGNWLDPWALWNLFVFSLACNALFLRFRHIGYCYAMHVGWNLTRFGGDFLKDGQVLPEGAAFNLIEGSPVVAAAITPLALALLLVFRDHWINPTKSSESPRT